MYGYFESATITTNTQTAETKPIIKSTITYAIQVLNLTRAKSPAKHITRGIPQKSIACTSQIILRSSFSGKAKWS